MAGKQFYSEIFFEDAGKSQLAQKHQRDAVEDLSAKLGKGLNDLSGINDGNLAELEALLAQSENMLQNQGVDTNIIDYEAIDTTSIDSLLTLTEEDWTSIKSYDFGKVSAIALDDETSWKSYVAAIEDYAEDKAVDLTVDFLKKLLTIDDYNEVLNLHKQFNKAYSERFFNEQRDSLLNIIIDRFGIGGIMARQDKDGGTIDTIHNAREGIYATDAERRNYENHPEYDSTPYHTDERYRTKNAQGRTARDAGTLADEYTGQKIGLDGNYDLDHIKSAKSIHDDAGRILAEKDGVALADRDENFAFTDRSINRSKKQKSASAFADELDNKRAERQARIDKLSHKRNLTDAEKSELNKYQKLNSVDTDELRRRGAQADKTYEKEVNKYYCSRKFISNLGKQSFTQGAAMGVRAIVGCFLTETISAVFDEIRDFCRTVKSMSKKWYEDLKERIQRIAARISAKWKEALQAGLTGFVSGFISNIVTVIINIFVTTAKNIVRIIREGFLSIVKAVKMLMNPPKGMTTRQLYHEAGKIIVSGITIVVGILAEEVIDKLPPMIAIREIPVIGELLADIIWGLLVGIATCIALWGWDKLDLFGAKVEAEDRFVLGAIESGEINI
jgi:hypothetical protein